MKIKIRLSAIISVLISISLFVVNVSATGYQRYTTQEIPGAEKNSFLEDRNIRLLNAESKATAISSFAISENGLIALGFVLPEKAEINVYNSTGQFLYGFCFNNNSGPLVIFFEDDTLCVIWGKTDYIFSLDPEGNCLQLRRYINSKKSADSYHNDRWRPESGAVGDIRYYAKKSWLSGYTSFSIENEDGSSTLIYEAPDDYYSQTAVTVGFGVVFLSILFVLMKYQDKDQSNLLREYKKDE